MSKELIERLREAAALRVGETAMLGADDLIAAANELYFLAEERDTWINACNQNSEARDAVAAERDALAAELKSLREQMPVGIVDEGDDGVFADLETTNGVLVKLGDKLYALPAPARELTDADIGRCIASADRSFEQEPISGSPVLGVWSRHLARAIERHMRGEGE